MTLEEVISECLERRLDFSLLWLDSGPEVVIEINLKDVEFPLKAEIINVFRNETHPYLTDDCLKLNTDYEGSWERVERSK